MSKHTKIAVFYHVAVMGTWEKVDKEIMDCLAKSKLLERADMFVRNIVRDIGLCEFPTLEMLDQFAISNPHYFILYVHTKGVSRPSKTIDDWRECMLYFNVEKWRDCVKKLEEGYDAVGINFLPEPLPHFQGNFWWVKASHIIRLGTVKGVEFIPTCDDQTERHKAEFWVLSQKCDYYTPYHHKVNPYLEINPRENYVQKQTDK